MELFYPSYYKKFSCVAGDCPDSCCHEWTVQVDRDAVERYKAVPGKLGEDLRRFLKEEDGEYWLENQEGRCPMWRQDGLCRIQCELGEEALCHVCANFPRLRQDYGSFVELGLEMSCPEAARIMLTEEDWEPVKESLPGGEEPDYDPEIMEILRRSRGYALGLMKLRGYAVNERLTILLMYGYHIQAQIDGAEELPFDPEAALEEARGFAGQGDFEEVLDFLGSLEILTERWKKRLDEERTEGLWTEELCKLAGYGIYRYWFQAVSDWDLAARVKLILLMAIIARNISDGAAERLETIQLCSKEIENNIDNVETILDSAYSDPALTDANLLGLLR